MLVDRAEYPYPVCPRCGEVCDELYLTELTREIIGCDRCLTTRNAYEYGEDHPEIMKDR